MYDVRCARKAYSPDNTAMEGVFGRMKVRMVHGCNWTGWTVGAFLR